MEFQIFILLLNSSVTQSYRDIQMPATVSQIYFSFDWKANGENNQDYMRVWLVPSTFVPTPGQQITSGGGRVQIGNNFGNNTSWENYTHTMNGASWSNQVMRLVFEWRNNAAGGGQPPAAVDNLNIQLINCPAPSMPTTGAITASEATLNWNAPTGAIVPSSYDYYFSTTTVAPTGTTTPVGNVLDTTVTLDNLSPSTTYYFWVRSNCGATGKGLWIGPRMFNSAQMPAPLDYSENFEAVNPGWTFNNGTQTNKWIIGTATQNGGTKSMYISNDNGVTNAYTTNIASVTQAYRDIQMPVSAGEMYFSFDWKANGENAQDYMRVWIVPATFTPTPGTQITAGGGRLQLGTNFGGQSTWQNFGLVMNALPAWQNQTIRLVFEWRNNANVGTQPPAAVDNIIVQLITCSTPSMPTIGSLTENEVTFNWNAPGGTVPTSYDYYFTTIPGAPNDTTVPTSNVPVTTATINNLVPSTTYYFWVRSNCGSDGTSLWVGPVSFNTPQIPTPLDYYENFEGANPGWTLNNGTQANKWVVGTATSNSPTHSLYISNDNGATNAYNGSSASVVQAYKDLMIPATAGQVYVSFDWKGTGEGSADYMRAWLVPVNYTPTAGNQIANGGGRVQLGTNFNQQSTWKTEDFVLNVPATWSGQIMRLVFEWRNDANTANQPPAAVDNVNFSVITCPAPSNPTLVSVATNTATTAWTGTSASYDYYYSTTNTAPEPTTTPSGNAATNQANLTGLTDATVYYFWVRSNCDVDGVSFWVGPLIFNTAQIPALLDYSEDFEDTNHGWTLNNGTQINKWVVGGATFNSPIQSLYISNDNGVTNAYNGSSASVVQAYKDLMIPATAGQIYISFDWKAQGEGNADYLRAWMVPVTYTPTPGTQITAGGGRVQLGTNYNQQNTWNTEGFVLNVLPTWSGQIMRLVFEWRNDTSVANQSPAAVDNVNVSVITCPAPSNPTLSAVTINSATTAWTGTSASYDYYYSTTNTSPGPTTTPSGSTATTQANLAGLNDSTTYYFWVRSDCGVDGVSFWVGPLAINTPQVPVNLPYYENFDGASSGFTLNNGMQSNKWVVGGATFNSPSQSLYVSNDNGMTNSYGGTTSVTQAYRDIQMPAGPLGQMLVSFDWKATGEGSFDYMRVWVVPVTFTPTPGTQITAGAGRMQIGANYNQQASWQTVNQVLNAPAAWAGQSIRLVFEWRNDGSVFNQPPAAVDNINISMITCSAPTNVALTAVTVDSATFTWNAPAGTAPASYDYYISTTNSSPSPTDTPTGTAPTTSVTVEGLDHSTQYFFWVRSNCGAVDGESFWIGPVNFNTPQIPAEMNFSDDFEGQIKWTFNNGTQGNKWVVGTATSNSPTHSLYISSDNGTTNSYAGSASVVQAYRDIQMPAVVNEVAFSFDWKGTGEGSFDYMRVWIVPTTFTPVPGTQITAGAGRIQIGANYNQQATWKNEFFILPAAQYQGQAVRVVFEWRNDGSVFNQPPAAVDNVILHALTCPSPTDLMASTTQGSSQVELTWTPVGTETQWEIIIQPSGSGTPSPNATGVIVNEPSYTFLADDDELYEFYVRPICSEDDIGLWSAPGNFSIFTPPGCASIDVVGVGVEIIDGAIFVCPDEDTEVNLSASFFGIAATTSYEVSSIDYAPPFPFVGGEVLSVTIDDRYSPVVDLPFNFCFFGESYSKAKVGSNGVVTFGNAGMPGADFCPWSFNQQLPNTGFPIKNSIFGVYQDTHPTATAGITNYQVLGTYPCRALVVNFYELPQFSCGSNVGLQTSQIVVYEISNIIEVYIGNRTPCTGWNSGNGVVGILNNSGTQAYTPPGRNTGAWSAQNEAWRFTPNGATNVDFQWLSEGQFLSDQQDITVSLTPAQIAELQANGTYTLTLTAEATYETCSDDDDPVTTSQDIDITFIYSYPDNEPMDLTSCSAVGDVIFDLTLNDVVMLQGADNPAVYTVTYYTSQADAESGDLSLAITDPENYVGLDGEVIWVRVSDLANCNTGIVKFFTLHQGELGDVVVDFTYDNTIYCIGGSNPVLIPATDFSTGGLFSVTPSGLTINAQTGFIDLSTSTAGDYTIKYEILPSECSLGGVTSFDIEVEGLATPDLDFSYAESCAMGIVNPMPIITALTPGGVFSSTTLTVDPQTGEIDLESAVEGIHEITYEIALNSTLCIDSGSVTVTIVLNEAIPNNQPMDLTSCSAVGDVEFNLTLNNLVMLQGSNNPTIYTVMYYTSQADAESGDPLLAITDLETYVGQDGEVIWVKVSDTTNCSAEVIKFFTLHHGELGEVNIDFTYDETIYCINGANPVITLGTDFSGGGLFSVSPAGLSIDIVTGSINLAAIGTLPGNYTITYEVLPNNCNAGGISTFNITVTNLIAPDLSFSYDDTCAIGTINPMPIITALTPGGVFSSTTLSVDPQTGEIDLSSGAGATAGVHDITYTVVANSTNCIDSGSATVSITLYDSIVPVTNFDYGVDAYCYSDTEALPIMATDFFEGGTYTATGNLDINPNTGIVNINPSKPGVYTITYTVAADETTCNTGSSSQATLTILGEFAIAVVDECRGSNYWLIANPVDDSFNPLTATYTWTIDGNVVGEDSEFDFTSYLNGADISQGGINVSVAINDGCDSYAEFLVTSSLCMIQKGISPNGDSANNSFDLTGMGVQKLSIFNRYGMEVYSKTNYVKEWTGLDNKGNELPDGTYFYVIQKNNGEKLSSWIYINRKY